MKITKVLLRDDFQLNFNAPLTRLCPPLKQRLNYMLWVKNLRMFKGFKMNLKNKCLDIGTGAAAIFPLLDSKLNISEKEKKKNFLRWIVSEIDGQNIKNALTNLTRNGLEKSVVVRKNFSEFIIKGIVRMNEFFHMTFCNPPFHKSLYHAGNNLKRSLNAISSEIIFPGGELEFVKIKIEESIEFQQQILWFTTILGKKQSAVLVRSQIFKTRCSFKETKINQGRQSRWCIAWSFFFKLRQKFTFDCSNNAIVIQKTIILRKDLDKLNRFDQSYSVERHVGGVAILFNKERKFVFRIKGKINLGKRNLIIFFYFLNLIQKRNFFIWLKTKIIK